MYIRWFNRVWKISWTSREILCHVFQPKDGTVRFTESTLLPLHYLHDDGTRSLVRRTNKATRKKKKKKEYALHKILLLALLMLLVLPLLLLRVFKESTFNFLKKMMNHKLMVATYRNIYIHTAKPTKDLIGHGNFARKSPINCSQCYIDCMSRKKKIFVRSKPWITMQRAPNV